MSALEPRSLLTRNVYIILNSILRHFCQGISSPPPYPVFQSRHVLSIHADSYISYEYTIFTSHTGTYHIPSLQPLIHITTLSMLENKSTQTCIFVFIHRVLVYNVKYFPNNLFSHEIIIQK